MRQKPNEAGEGKSANIINRINTINYAIDRLIFYQHTLTPSLPLPASCIHTHTRQN